MAEEVERHIFDELSKFQLLFDEWIMQKENALEQSIKEVSYAFERANSEIAKKILEVYQSIIELLNGNMGFDRVHENGTWNGPGNISLVD